MYTSDTQANISLIQVIFKNHIFYNPIKKEVHHMVQLRILEILEEQGHTKYWLYKRMDMLSYNNFKNIVENKTSAIRFETLNKLQRILDVPIGELFQVTEDEKEEQ